MPDERYVGWWATVHSLISNTHALRLENPETGEVVYKPHLTKLRAKASAARKGAVPHPHPEMVVHAAR